MSLVLGLLTHRVWLGRLPTSHSVGRNVWIVSKASKVYPAHSRRPNKQY